MTNQKIEKLELRHLAGYLPYGLKSMILSPFYGNEPLISEVTLYNVMNFIERNTLSKILLRPLSGLTNEIEHNGERFVPIVEIAKKIAGISYVIEPLIKQDGDHVGVKFKVFSGLYQDVVFSTRHGFSTQVYNRGKHMVLCENQIEAWELLYKLHFDIHGLLDSGLAVDINTVKA